jgi:hypothetical protein
MGIKALPGSPSMELGDTMNGYALVRARIPIEEMLASIVMEKRLYEIDDVPDPRLYRINVQKLRDLANERCSECAIKMDTRGRNKSIRAKEPG